MAGDLKTAKKCSECGKFNSHLAKTCQSCGSEKLLKKGQYPKMEVNNNWASKVSKTAKPETPSLFPPTDERPPMPTTEPHRKAADFIADYIATGEFGRASRILKALEENAKP